MVDIYYFNEQVKQYELIGEAGDQASDSVPEHLDLENLIFRELEVFPSRFEKRELVGTTDDGRGMYRPTVLGLKDSVDELYPTAEEIGAVIDKIKLTAGQNNYDAAAIKMDISGISTDDQSLIMISYSMVVAYFIKRKPVLRLIPVSHKPVVS
ncbi:MAG: hypothetical protein Q8Q01_05085 [archaeon]|nr:hypothetical protein [archaeon]